MCKYIYFIYICVYIHVYMYPDAFHSYTIVPVSQYRHRTHVSSAYKLESRASRYVRERAVHAEYIARLDHFAAFLPF